MGIPKFFRYISERYPCLSETLKEYQIPEFDNLYLDMNGIIHGCSHPNDDVVYYVSEETIFKNIFHYIEILFRMIQPQKLFFMAIDGVAPRAKINQQRSRRFRAAKEAEVKIQQAKAKAIDVPVDKRFDSNCITPGTLFMSNLNEQLKYFITYKISTDELWQRCKVIFSGSEVAGEGEHKIMDYIRYMKSQPDYDIDTRHCLYGLDADLIMLGLCTHELYFTLLREEVNFGKRQKKIQTPEETKFCLLHLSLLREYIDREFSSLREKLSFPYDLEKIIDDWVLMGFLIGNDFIPQLPNLHLLNVAVPVLYHVYTDVLPTLDGYINESGVLRLDRFEKFMERLSRFDIEQFADYYADLKYFVGKTGRRPNESERQPLKKSDYAYEESASPKKVHKELDALIKSTNEMVLGQSDEDEAGDDESDSDIYNMEFVQHKRDYYMNKLEYENVDAEFLRSQAEGYVRAIQWNLHYYYHGCCSWSWYYPHHYAPYISDIKDFKDLKLEFELGQPFLPLEQLLAVLPPYSKELLPEAFQSLLTEENSPIIDYYPVEFKTDLNGKQQVWEAVVLIPFIDEKLLLEAMMPLYPNLTSEEKRRNRHGPMCLYAHTNENLGKYAAPEFFPDIVSHAKVDLLSREDIFVPKDKLVKGLCSGVHPDIYHFGFPTLQHIKHTACIEKPKVRVFSQPSRGENMILHFEQQTVPNLKSMAAQLLGRTVFVNWPYLTEALVDSVANAYTKISLIDTQMKYCNENVQEEPLKGAQFSQWNIKKKHITEVYKGRLGIDIGETNILVFARPIIGNKYVYGSHGRLSVEKQWSEMPEGYAYQAVVTDIKTYCVNTLQYKTVNEIFSPGSVCFMLGHPHYGAIGEVLEISEKSGRIRVSMNVSPEPSFEGVKRAHGNLKTRYMHGLIAAQRLGISSHLVSRITGTIYVEQSTGESGQDGSKHNIGLNLKFNKKNEEIPGYTKKENGQWLYSMKAVELVRSYMAKCPKLFERLARNVGSDIFQDEKLFDDKTEELADLLLWLREQLQGMESRPCDIETVDPQIVEQIEAEIDAFHAVETNNPKNALMRVKPHLLFKPNLHLRNSPPDIKSQNRLLDRIVCTRSSFTVPLGFKGVIVGVQVGEKVMSTMYDVLFDKPFPGGLVINGCSEGRGYRLSASDFLNLSYGERVEHGKTTGADTPVESDHRKAFSKANAEAQSNTSAFATFKKDGKHLSNESPPNIRIMSKNSKEVNQNNHIRLVPDMYDQKQSSSQASRQRIQKKAREPQQNACTDTATKPPAKQMTTEFQALWNELHKKQKPGKEFFSSETSASSTPDVQQLKQNSQTGSDKFQQDPSAFLKAMLKISDGGGQQSVVQSSVPSSPAANAISQTGKASEAPPLVQQLFDHARQNEKVKDEKAPIWYCSQLLNHYQLRGDGMPRYAYYADDETKLIRAHIALPDNARVFVGDACINHEQAAGSAAKKVYTELNLASVRPDMKALLPPPQQWFNARTIGSWSQNMRQAPIMPIFPLVPQGPQGPQLYSPWMNKVPQNPPYPQMMMYPNQCKPQQECAYSEPKSEVKSSTPFVPLQAQKKSINATKHAAKETSQSAKDNPQSVAQPRKGAASGETSKPESVAVSNEKQAVTQSSNSQPLPKSQKPSKPRRSRVAAKFNTPTQVEQTPSKDST